MSKKSAPAHTEKKRNYRSQIIAILLALCVVAISAFGGISYTLSKYAISLDTDYHDIEAKAFFFNSDYLTQAGVTYNVYNWTSGVYQTIRLMNYPDSLNNTADNITFTLSGTTGLAIQTTGGSATTGGTITGGANNDYDFRIVPQSAGSYTITATSSAPYYQTLTATFVFTANDQPAVAFTLDNTNSAYAVMTVVTAPSLNSTVNTRLAWDTSTITIDSTNALTGGTPSVSGNYSYFDITLNTGSSYQFVLYKVTAGSTLLAASSLVGAGTDRYCYCGAV